MNYDARVWSTDRSDLGGAVLLAVSALPADDLARRFRLTVSVQHRDPVRREKSSRHTRGERCRPAAHEPQSGQILGRNLGIHHHLNHRGIEDHGTDGALLDDPYE